MTIDNHDTVSHVLVPSRRVRSRYSISGRTLSRWRLQSDLAFPPAIMINGRCYFDEALLTEWERARIVAATEVTS